MDHHCPWMNNCIGIKNLKSFLLFNMYTALCGMYSFTRTLVEIILFFKDDSTCYTYQNALKKGLGMAGMCLCALFVCFTTCMFVDQIKMRFEETSTIDKK